jgi:hypothetical protein
MALNANVLGALMKAAVDNVVVSTEEGVPLNRDDLFQALADAIITHITSAGVVTVTSVTGVTVGGGVSGPGTGTIS